MLLAYVAVHVGSTTSLPAQDLMFLPRIPILDGIVEDGHIRNRGSIRRIYGRGDGEK